MKKSFVFAAVAAALMLPIASFAAKGNKGGDKGDKGGKGEPAARFDSNHNGKIEKGAEADALRAAFEGDKTGPLKKYDTNHNGNLEDREINAISVPIKRGKK